MSTFYINGDKYDTSQHIITTLMNVAMNNGGTLSDYTFEQVVQEYGADEEKVMEEMAFSNTPLFHRFSTGWDVTE